MAFQHFFRTDFSTCFYKEEQILCGFFGIINIQKVEFGNGKISQLREIILKEKPDIEVFIGGGIIMFGVGIILTSREKKYSTKRKKFF